MKLLEIKPSTRKEKKLMAVFEMDDGRNKTVHFGQKGYGDFTSHSDYKKKHSYIARHYFNENWSDPDNAGSLSRWILWNRPSLNESIADFKAKFDL